MNQLYNVLLVLGIIGIVVPFLIGAIKDSNQSFSDLKNRKKQFVEKGTRASKRPIKEHA